MGLTRPRFSQFDTSILTFTDPLQQVNFLADKANIDIGWVMNRDGGISSNVAIIWQESAGAFALATTTSSGAPPAANLTITSYANLIISTLTANSITTSGNITATYFLGSGASLSGNITVGNIIVPTGAGRFNGPFNESTTIQGVYVGNLNLSPRIGFFNGTASQNWQIDNNFGTFRWYTPGVVRMTIDTGGNLNVPSGNIMSAGNVTAKTGGFNNVIVNTGNINAVGGYFVGNGYFLTGIVASGSTYGNTQVSSYLTAGTGIILTTNVSASTLTISTGTPGAFGSAGDFGAITDAATVIEDAGSVADSATLTYDLGSIISASGLIYPDQLVLPIYTTASLPTASRAAAEVVYDSTNQTVKYSDGSKWNPVAAQSYAVAMSVALG